MTKDILCSVSKKTILLLDSMWLVFEEMLLLSSAYKVVRDAFMHLHVACAILYITSGVQYLPAIDFTSNLL